MHKKIISTIALGVIIGASTICANANPKLSDVNGHWANKEIQQFISNGFINGYEDGTFKPDNSITRAEFVKIANKYFGFTAKGNENFTDVNQGDWFYNDICIAQKEGYINGYEDGTFKPDKTITREEAAKIITWIKNREDVKIDKLNNFIDGHKVSDWAKKYVEGAIEFGYIKGDDKGKINPLSNITRAESVSMLSRVVNEVPVVTIHNPIIELNIGDKWSNDLIKYTATDKEDTEPNALAINIAGNVDTSKAGEYRVTVSATDLEGATGSSTCKVIVKEAPVGNYDPNSGAFKSAVTSQMVALVNQHREDCGVPALNNVGRLNTSANAWSKYMADNGFFDHVAPGGQTANGMYPQYGPISGENIAATQLIVTGDMQQDAHNLANELFGMWKNSSGHNANMIDDLFADFGFGFHAVKVGDTGTTYSIYATQHFSGDVSGAEAPKDEVKK
ncbi:MAG: S-layer homology domain-containing protein [Paeniclostridium sordellii]|nr:S-layer homology domain-containing protein [Paeniclostridium sordellii]